nr:MAG TPA: hypothetical protein [Caudoviricetes sp.]
MTHSLLGGIRCEKKILRAKIQIGFCTQRLG